MAALWKKWMWGIQEQVCAKPNPAQISWPAEEKGFCGVVLIFICFLSIYFFIIWVQYLSLLIVKEKMKLCLIAATYMTQYNL